MSDLKLDDLISRIENPHPMQGKGYSVSFNDGRRNDTIEYTDPAGNDGTIELGNLPQSVQNEIGAADSGYDKLLIIQEHLESADSYQSSLDLSWIFGSASGQASTEMNATPNVWDSFQDLLSLIPV